MVFGANLKGKRVSTSIRDKRLGDGTWHTIIVAISGPVVNIYLDCDKIKTK